MLSFLQQLRARWIAILFAILCSSAVPWEHIWTIPRFQSFMHFGFGLRWPLSLIYQIAFLTLLNFITLVIVVGVYQIVVASATRSDTP